MNMTLQFEIHLAKSSPFGVDDHFFGGIVVFASPFRNVVQTFKIARIRS
jgi:hypothetical protein